MPELRLLTVAVCTHNRAVILRDTLDHLARARVPSGWGVQYLVVDNASADDTPGTVRRAPLPEPAELLHCPELGISHARNMAVSHARGEAIVWLDDDVRVDPGILEAYAAALDRHPDRALFGGPVDPFFLNQPPDWVKRVPPQLWPVYSLRAVSGPDDPFENGRTPVGANFMARTVVHREVAIDPRLGRRAATGPLGEESEFFREALALGHRGVWVPAARLAHYVPPGRQTARYVAAWYAAYAEGREVTAGAKAPAAVRLFGVPRWAIRVWVESMVRYLVHRLRSDPAAWLPAICAAGSAWGVLRYHLRTGRA